MNAEKYYREESIKNEWIYQSVDGVNYNEIVIPLDDIVKLLDGYLYHHIEEVKRKDIAMYYLQNLNGRETEEEVFNYSVQCFIDELIASAKDLKT